MKFNTTIPATLQPFFQNELADYEKELNSGNFANAWTHLERAHIIGQQFPLSHSFVHLKMLQFGFNIKDFNEIVGQLPRLLVGGVKSFVGVIPVGNPGGANVPPLKSFPIPKDINEIFIQAGIK